jgi:hypothetical protein
MSDIIYTPPASGGGTTINPTNSFIPVRSNATTFIDSNIVNVVDTYLNANVGGYGLFLDTNIGEYILGYADAGFKIENYNTNFYMGDYGFSSSGTYIVVQNSNELITTYNQGNEVGLKLDFTNKLYQLGDFNGTSNITYIVVDDGGEFFVTFNQGNDVGLLLDFGKRRYYLGDFSNYINGTTLEIREDVDTIITRNNFGSQGISLDLGTLFYKFGDYDALVNNTHIAVKDSSQEINLFTNGGSIFFSADSLIFDGAGLQSNTAGGNSGEHLVITLNGSQYKIKLENP